MSDLSGECGYKGVLGLVRKLSEHEQECSETVTKMKIARTPQKFFDAAKKAMAENLQEKKTSTK